MNLSIRKYGGGGFFIQLDGANLTALMNQAEKGLVRTLAAVDGVQGTSNTLTLAVGSDTVTFRSFSDLIERLNLTMDNLGNASEFASQPPEKLDP